MDVAVICKVKAVHIALKNTILREQIISRSYVPACYLADANLCKTCAFKVICITVNLGPAADCQCISKEVSDMAFAVIFKRALNEHAVFIKYIVMSINGLSALYSSKGVGVEVIHIFINSLPAAKEIAVNCIIEFTVNLK